MTWLRVLLGCCCLTLVGCSTKCELDDDLRLFAGEAAHDCGSAENTEQRVAVDACVADAFETKHGFIARYPTQGEDSKLVTAVAGNSAGVVKLFQWDSAPCGGPGCDPVTDVQSCEAPSLTARTSEDPDALPITCESYGLAERTCG
jgi:hypothetical protein